MQKFFDAGLNHFCDYIVCHINNTEVIKKLEEKKYLNTSLYDFYDLILLKKTTELSKTHYYIVIVTCSVGFFTNILVAATLILSWKFWRHSIGILLTMACVDIIGSGVCFTFLLMKLHLSHVGFIVYCTSNVD